MKILTDTSVLVKGLLREEGWQEALRIWDDADLIYASRLAYPEARAALAAATRASRIGRGQHDTLVADLDRRWSQVAVLELTDRLARLAGDVADRYALRSGDSVHLASVLILQDPETLLATWDRRLGRAAAAAEVPVIPAPG